ncbi:hypothetical protein JT06_10320 [Desulfobulbus sp. Tol-SR]|jgi:hypothetical protein|nr:hypothetical protein JT06_10320 [Desulfobulbus sp. Tol-SR]
MERSGLLINSTTSLFPGDCLFFFFLVMPDRIPDYMSFTYAIKQMNSLLLDSTDKVKAEMPKMNGECSILCQQQFNFTQYFSKIYF